MVLLGRSRCPFTLFTTSNLRSRFFPHRRLPDITVPDSVPSLKRRRPRFLYKVTKWNRPCFRTFAGGVYSFLVEFSLESLDFVGEEALRAPCAHPAATHCSAAGGGTAPLAAADAQALRQGTDGRHHAGWLS